jgi:hypothetical protein
LSLEDIPTYFSDSMGISLETAQVLLSIVVILTVLLPVFFLARGRRGIMIELFLFFLTESFLVGIGWMPFWILIATIACMAMAVALFGTRIVTGG